MVNPAHLVSPTAPRPRPLVAADGTCLAADHSGGDGPGVLLTHGFGQTRQAWSATQQRLADAGLASLAWDLRGHGQSGRNPPDSRYSGPQFVSDVVTAAGLGGFNATSAREYFLPAFASVFLGTVAVVPGRFNPLGMFIAVYFLITGIFGLQLLGYQGWVTDVFYGGVLVAAVAASAYVRRRLGG